MISCNSKVYQAVLSSESKLFPWLLGAYTLAAHRRFSALEEHSLADVLDECNTEERLGSLTKVLRGDIRPVYARGRRREQRNRFWKPQSLPSADLPVEIEQLSVVVRRKGASSDLDKALDELAIAITPHHVCETLKSIDNVNAAVRFFNWAGLQQDFYHNIITYMSLVKILAQAKVFDKVWELLVEMQNSGSQLTDGFFNIVIKAYGEMGNVNGAIWTLREMRSFGVTPTAYTFNTLVSVLIKAQKLDLAWEIYQETLQVQNLSGNLFAFSMMIDGFCEAGRMQDVLKVADDMRHIRLALGVVHWTALINGFCKGGNVEEGLKLFSKMKEMGVMPNVVTYSSVIHGLCRTGQVDEAMSHFKCMKNDGCHPNVITYSILVDGFCKAGRIDEGHTFLKQVLEEGGKVNQVVYYVLVGGYSKLGKLHEACAICKDMIDRGFWPNSATYSLLIQGLCKTGRIDEAYEFFHDMKTKKCWPNAAVYNTMTYSLSKAGRKDEAEKMFLDMLSEGYKATSSTCSALFSCLCEQDCPERVVELFKVMHMKGCGLTMAKFNLHLKELCDANKVDSAHQLLKQLVGNGSSPNPCAYNVLINGAIKAGDIDKAMMFYFEMCSNGCDPDYYTYRPLFQALCNAKRADAVLNVFHDMRVRHISPDPFIFTILISGLCKMNKVAEARDLFSAMIKEGFVPRGSNIRGLLPSVVVFEEKNVATLKPYIILLNHLQVHGKVTEMVSIWDLVLEKGMFRWIDPGGT